MADLSVLTQDWVATWDQEPTRQYIQLYTAASTSWTAPTGVTAVKVELWGGGGTGGTAQGNPSYAGGGAGGQYAVTNAYTVTPGNSYTVAVGQETTSVLDTQTAGSDSTFNSTGVVAKGGAGAVNATGSTGAGASGSSGSGVGDTVYAGGSGGNGVAATVSGGGGGGAGSTGDGNPGTDGTAGTAKSEYGGAGGAGVSTGNTRNTGGTYGGGGSGGCATGSTNRRGGNGAAGLARLTWTLPYGTGKDLDLEVVTLSDTATATLGATPTQTVELREGATVIKAIDLTTVTGDWQTFSTDLSTDERNSITDWSALRVAVIANTSRLDVSWVELYAPLSAGAQPVTVPTQTETVTLSDTGTALLNLLETASIETVTLSETGTRAACDERAVPTADTLTVSETGTRAACDERALPDAELLTLSETGTAAVLTPLLGTGTDTLTLSETGTRAACDERATPSAETLTLSETAPAVLDPLCAPTADTLTLSEVDPPPAQRIDYEGETIPCVVTDQGQVTLTEAVATWIAPLRQAATETVTLSETGTQGACDERATPTADTVTLSDTGTRGACDERATPTADTLTLSDAGTGQVDLLPVAVSDTLTVTDQGTAEGDRDVTVTETVTLSDLWAEAWVEVRQGDTVIASWRLDGLTTSWTTVTGSLTAGERAAITDWSALRVAVRANGQRLDVSWVQFETPKQSGGLTVPAAFEAVTLSDAVVAARTLTTAVTETVTVGDVSTTQPPPTIRVYEITITVPFVPEIPLEGEAAEYLVVADDLAARTSLPVQRNEFLTLTSSATAVVTPARALSQEATILSETVTVEADLNATGTDVVTLGEVAVASEDLDVVPDAETVTLSEAVSGDLDLNTVVPDTLTLSEAAPAVLTPLQATIADQGGLTVTDVATPVLDPLRAALSDTLTLSETGTTASMGLTVVETATLGERGTVEYWQGVRITDVPTVNRVRPGAWGEEELHLTDPVQATVGLIEVRRADGVVLEDVGWGARSGEYRERFCEDAVPVAEQGQVEYVKPITVTDLATAVRVDDTRFVYRVETLTLSEVVTLPADADVRDTLTWDEGGGADFYDVTVPLLITDVATVRLDVLVVTATESLTLSDSGTPFIADLAASGWDSVLLSDAATADRPPVVVRADTLVWSEAGTRAQRLEYQTWGIEVREWVWPWETVTGEVAFEARASSTLTLTDTGAGELDVLDTSASDAVTLSETVTVALDPLLAAVTQRIDVSDEVFRLSATGDDTVTLSDAASGVLSEGVLVPAERTWRVPAEARTYRIETSDRTWRVPADDRTWHVHAEDRTWRSEADDD